MLEVGYSCRVKLGMTFIVIVILVSSSRQLSSTLSAFRHLPQTDDISQYERRFDKARQFLPTSRVVSYSDEFAPFLLQCNAFVLAQYSLAPTVLAVEDSQCGHMKTSSEISSHKSQLVLDNFHNPRQEPYLLHLFPDTYFQPHKGSPSLAGGQTSRADQVVLLQDFGLGVRLYTRGEE